MAMGIGKADRYGSTLTKGYSTNRLDKSVRRFRVDGTTNLTKQVSLNEAINFVKQQLDLESPGGNGNSHPATGVPLADITARRWGPAKIEVIVRYARRFRSVPTQSAFVIARKRSESYATQWYQHTISIFGDPAFDSLGRPVGEVVFLNRDDPLTITGKDIPVPWSWVQQGLRITVPTVLDFDPTSQVDQLLDKTNSDNISFGSLSFAANSIRFDGLSVVDIDTPSGLKFDVNYSFLALRAGFYAQIASFDTAWDFPMGDSNERAVFAGSFPVHF